jgi:hypothetical protein
MLARADSLGVLALSASSPAPFPAWARAVEAPETEAEAAYLAGAALSRLDAIARENPPWAGVWRRRLALTAAAASVRRAGRAEDEAALRDALHLRRPGDDAGPAGMRLVAWRALTARSVGLWPQSVDAAAEVVGVKRDDALQDIIEAAQACVAGGLPAPFAAAEAAATTLRILRSALPTLGSDAELLALWLADAVLAQLLKWPFALPLLAAHLFTGSGRRAGPGAAAVDENWVRPCCLAYARAAAQACDLSADLERRAKKLHEVAPKLRAKGAGAALQALLDDDSLSAATKIGGLSQRGARRLFDRLVALGAIRELTGRSTFRLYGL